MKRILVAAPLDYELKFINPILKKLSKNFDFYTITLGVGPKKSSKNFNNFLDHNSNWDLVLVVGLSGALTSKFKTGDWVIPSSVSDRNETIQVHESLSDVNCKAASFFTSHKILKAEEKRELVQKNSDYEIVDMETFYLAQILEQRKMSYSVLRVVLDERDYIFPDFKLVFRPLSIANSLKLCGVGLKDPKEFFRFFEFKTKLRKSLKELAQFTKSRLQNI